LLIAPRMTRRVAVVAVVAALLGATAESVRAAATSAPPSLNVIDRLVKVTTRLRRASPEIMPNPALAPLIDHLSRGTARGRRVRGGGFGPEIPVLAGRPFAAGLPTWIPGYYDDEADLQRALARLHREDVSAAVLLDGTNAFTRSWPPLADAMRARAFDEYAVP